MSTKAGGVLDQEQLHLQPRPALAELLPREGPVLLKVFRPARGVPLREARAVRPLKLARQVLRSGMESKVPLELEANAFQTLG